MALLDTVSISRPDSCNHCDFGYDDSDEGPMCTLAGHRRVHVLNPGERIGGKGKYFYVDNPADAERLKYDCGFVEKKKGV